MTQVATVRDQHALGAAREPHRDRVAQVSERVGRSAQEREPARRAGADAERNARARVRAGARREAAGCLARVDGGGRAAIATSSVAEIDVPITLSPPVK